MTSIFLTVSTDLTDDGRDHDAAFRPSIRTDCLLGASRTAPLSAYGNGCDSHYRLRRGHRSTAENVDYRDIQNWYVS